MNCFMCKGILEDKHSSFMVDIENRFFIVKNVPSQVCRQCGEVSYNHDVINILNKILNDMKYADTELVITNFVLEVA